MRRALCRVRVLDDRDARLELISCFGRPSCWALRLASVSCARWAARGVLLAGSRADTVPMCLPGAGKLVAGPCRSLPSAQRAFSPDLCRARRFGGCSIGTGWASKDCRHV